LVTFVGQKSARNLAALKIASIQRNDEAIHSTPPICQGLHALTIKAVPAWRFRFLIGDYRFAATGSALRPARIRFPKPRRRPRRIGNGHLYTSLRTRSGSESRGTQARDADAQQVGRQRTRSMRQA